MACTVCAHEQRSEIDAALLQKAPARAVGRRFGLTHHALGRHRKSHLAGQLAYLNAERDAIGTRVALDDVAAAVQALEKRVPGEVVTLETADDVLFEGRRLYGKIWAILSEAERTGDTRVALRAIKEARETLELFGRAFKMFDEGGTTIDRSTKILAVLGQASEADLRRLLTDGAAA